MDGILAGNALTFGINKYIMQPCFVKTALAEWRLL
jgi:hypothetical protein